MGWPIVREVQAKPWLREKVSAIDGALDNNVYGISKFFSSKRL
jgi:hypothetical protein